MKALSIKPKYTGRQYLEVDATVFVFPFIKKPFYQRLSYGTIIVPRKGVVTSNQGPSFGDKSVEKGSTPIPCLGISDHIS